MARHRRTKIEPARGEAVGRRLYRSVTIMMDLNEDKTVTAIIGVMNLNTRRYDFIRMPLRTWWGRPDSAFTEALITLAQDAMLDAELKDRLR